MVSHPETGSDSPIGSDRDRGRDNPTVARINDEHHFFFIHRPMVSRK